MTTVLTHLLKDESVLSTQARSPKTTTLPPWWDATSEWVPNLLGAISGIVHSLGEASSGSRQLGVEFRQEQAAPYQNKSNMMMEHGHS